MRVSRPVRVGIAVERAGRCSIRVDMTVVEVEDALEVLSECRVGCRFV